jgi:hypothetical protein
MRRKKQKENGMFPILMGIQTKGILKVTNSLSLFLDGSTNFLSAGGISPCLFTETLEEL